jgi:hypothetical protein
MDPTFVGSSAWAAAPWAILGDRGPWIAATGHSCWPLLLAKPFVAIILGITDGLVRRSPLRDFCGHTEGDIQELTGETLLHLSRWIGRG